MARESSNQALRDVRTLYAIGPVGVLTDAQLVERFLQDDGAGREEAFAALVQRHGPMVLRICRRMLGGSADAEDAFQAVFFVLARKAGALRRVEGLKSWLYGVAVRTAKEARRRSAKQRAREDRAMDASKAVSAPDRERDDVLALLDEEIERLPSRLRDPIMLCELEGASREDASRQLGVPEGTLSSRLSRARALLRDRLNRRGVALGAGLSAILVSETANAALPQTLADSTVSLALKFAARSATAGTIPAVYSLAEGMLKMILVAKLKRTLAATVSLGALVCLTAGVVWALENRLPDQTREAKPATSDTASKTEPQGNRPTANEAIARGLVVDEVGTPVAGVEVRADPFTAHETRGVSGRDGSFAISIGRPQIDGTALLARSADGDRAGAFQYPFGLSEESAQTPARVVLKKQRDVVVRVARDDKGPVSGAAVQAAGTLRILDEARTGSDGSARLRVPSDARVSWLIAVKPGEGADYAEFGDFDEAGRSKGGALGADLPASIPLTLEGGRTARIKAVDSRGAALTGVSFSLWLLRKEGRRSHVNVASRLFTATTGSDGIATFDWLPRTSQDLTFWPNQDRYAHRRVMIEDGKGDLVTATLVRTETIRGRVTRLGGAPASGIQIRAYGTGKGFDNGQAWARTVADGSYELQISPGEAYAVYVDDKEWAAPSRLDVVVREGKPVAGIDFALTRGTLVRGTVTVGAANRPVSNQFVRLDETGGPAPEELREKGDRFGRDVRRQFGARTDAEGKYSIRVGPGTYTLMGPPRTKDEKITIKDEAEVIRDFQMPRPEKGTLSGRVVGPGATGHGIAGAKVEIVAANRLAVPFVVIADADGRFRTERDLDRLVICAKSPDGAQGAIVEVGAEAPDVVISVAPTATATGRLLDTDGRPAANRRADWGRRVFLDEEELISMTCFAPKVITDSEGRFTLPSLVVGQEYSISLMKENLYQWAGSVRPTSADTIELGTLRAGTRPAHEEEPSSFRKNAPSTGAVAPMIEAMTLDGKALRLDEFKGKYVLLDFWATWCAPCLGEIPQLQAVHEAFGKDERFAILSVSVDETVEEPRKFQEKRKLPWTQAFLGGGIHGPVPGTFGVQAIPAFVLVGPDGRIVARGMRGDEIKKEVAKALGKMP